MNQTLSLLAFPLLTWYHQNKRDLPWRADPTPYHVWISEIMLQQTRVEAVKEYYRNFLHHFPDIDALADADEQLLAKCWEGLGYYSRMRNLSRCAKLLRDAYDGNLPSDYDALIKLPGIGSYTAGAIASIAFGQKVPAVDGNVLRVMSRSFADTAPIDEQKTKNFWFDALLAAMPEDAGSYNQALMELGATVCLPNGAPLCERCPVKPFCIAGKTGSYANYPVKKPKKARRIEQKSYLILRCDEKYLLHKRPDTGLLASLWEYPNLDHHASEDEIIAEVQKRGGKLLAIKPLSDTKHIFTHIEWQIKGYLVEAASILPGENEVLVTEQELKEAYALPSAFDKYPRNDL